ncbi:MAG: exodeoxyribonuclease VII large subunit, partial [Candidatus Zixiibacteriota bacterium]
METKIYTVSELTREIKLTLESGFPAIWVEGEISNYKLHSSGHRYFSLKDSESQLRCVLWRWQSGRLPAELKDGLQIIACGNLTVFERAGQYQLVVATIQPVGVGRLEIEFQELKRKLFEEGLFSEEFKKPLPGYPEKIGVVTSPTGAAIRDIINILQRRFPPVEIILRPTLVQGEGAAEDIVSAIEEFNECGEVDLIIVGRGGGSIEDLWAFNEEKVARAIFSSEIPIVSAVGHEIDFTISDFASDLRAPTPSAAAELAVPDRAELMRNIVDLHASMANLMQGQLAEVGQRLDYLRESYGFRRFLEMLDSRQEQLTNLQESLSAAFGRVIQDKRNRLMMSSEKLSALS